MPEGIKGFQPGNPGKPFGAQNRLNRTVKETVLTVFQELQGDSVHNLTAFAKKHPRDFYQIAAKLIPQEIQAKLSKITVEVVRDNKTPVEPPASGAEDGTGPVEAL